jgi:hypothetical protein
MGAVQVEERRIVGPYEEGEHGDHSKKPYQISTIFTLMEWDPSPKVIYNSL